MKEIWVLTVKTSLPNTCKNSSDLTTTCQAFDSFEKGRDALRETIRQFAFSKNSMFDGKGNITYLKQYVEVCDGEVYEDDFEVLDINRINYVINSLRDAFSGKEVDFEMESEYCTDWMIAINSKPGEVSFCGEYDGPCNGYDPDLRTNIFSMKEECYVNSGIGCVFFTTIEPFYQMHYYITDENDIPKLSSQFVQVIKGKRTL